MNADIISFVAYATSGIGFVVVAVGITCFVLWVIAGTIALMGLRR